MINHLRLKNHKALEQVILKDIGRINVICGKNNSGKTTLLETMCDPSLVGIGKQIDSPGWLVQLFDSEAKRFTTPNPRDTLTWFNEYAMDLHDSNTIWYSDEEEAIIDGIKKSFESSYPINRYNSSTYNYKRVTDSFFRKSKQFFNPILIPPKRRIRFQTTIDTNEEIEPNGTGLINYLFYLKNQDLESHEHGKYRSIYKTFEEITNSKFNVIPHTNNKIELYYQTDNEWIAAEDCGLGLTDVLVIVTVLNVIDSNIILLEEPENHLHADFQKRLLNYLTTIKNKQFFISTHSSVFINTDIIDKIFYCQCKPNVAVSDQTSKSEIISSLGYSFTENLVADLIILLEGPSDIPVIKEMLKWVGIGPEHNIKYWPLGGDIMSSLDLSVFAERNNIVALIDSDPGSSVQRTRFQRNCKANQIQCTKLKRYAIENYFTLDALRNEFPGQIPVRIKTIVPDVSVDDQIGFKKKKKTIKGRNGAIVKRMSHEDIDNTDLESFLIKTKKLLTSGLN